MKKKPFVVYLVVLLLGTFAYSANNDYEEFPDEIIKEAVIFEISRGEYYFSYPETGWDLRPRCFAVDPNDGSFYIPEVDSRKNIRIQKFDRYGKNRRIINIDHKTEGTTNITIDTAGNIYLNCIAHHNYSYVIKCDKEGKFLRMIGVAEPITDIDLEKAKEESKMGNQPKYQVYRGKLFNGIFRKFIVNGDMLDIDEHSENDLAFHQLNLKTGKKIKKLKGNKYPNQLLIERRNCLDKNDKYSKIARRMKRTSYGLNLGILTNDNIGKEYHMVVSPEKLQIRKFKFIKTKGQLKRSNPVN